MQSPSPVLSPPIGTVPMAAPGLGARINALRFVAALLLLVGGVLSAISVAFSWWTINQSGANPTTIYFLPGGSLKLTSSSASITATYASVQLGQVGALYEAILALAIVIACLAIVVGVLVLISALGRWQNPARYTTFRNFVLIVLVVSLFLAILVPAAQGALIRQGPNSGAGLCTLNSASTTPCSAFWGSSSGSGNNDSWGADVGWYLVVVTTVLLFVAFFLWRSARNAPWGAPGAPIPGQVAVGYPTGAMPSAESPVDKLLRAKALADAAQITPAEFEELKARLMGQVTATASDPGSVASPPPEVELAKLKSLHDSGAISDAEYSELRRKVLLRF